MRRGVNCRCEWSGVNVILGASRFDNSTKLDQEFATVCSDLHESKIGRNEVCRGFGGCWRRMVFDRWWDDDWMDGCGRWSERSEFARHRDLMSGDMKCPCVIDGGVV